MPNVLPFVNSERIETYAQALKNSTGNDFGSDIWSFTDRDGTRESRIHFSLFSEIFSDFDLNIAKAFIAYMYSQYGTVSKVKTVHQQIKVFGTFLSERHLSLSSFSNKICMSYHDWLDQQYDSNSLEYRNQLESFLPQLVLFFRIIGLLGMEEEIIFPRLRKVPAHSPKKAPPAKDIHALDQYFFDFANSVPSDIRAIYLIGRFFPERVCEPLMMRIDGIEIDRELAILSIPTTKETPETTPVFDKYPLLVNGCYESILLKAVLEQKKYAQKHQKKTLQASVKGRLFLSTQNPTKLLTPKMINDYLKKVIQALDLRDANGQLCNYTYHALRHLKAVEFTSDAEIPSDLISSLFCHSRESTVSSHYATPADVDILAISPMQESTELEQTKYLSRRFEQEAAKSGVRIIGADAICYQDDQKCSAQYAQCWSGCLHFHPDPKFVSHAATICDILQRRIAAQKSEIDVNLSELSFDEYQLSLYQDFIATVMQQEDIANLKDEDTAICR